MKTHPNRKPYPTDLTDVQWQILEPLLPKAVTNRGRERQYPYRELLNAIFYILRSGCVWRLLPHDFPPWFTVYYYFRQWRLSGLWERIMKVLREELRMAVGREPEPSAAIIDSQSIKTDPNPGPRGYDAGKKVKGRKRHILVDTLGLILVVVVHVANIQDRDGAKLVFTKAKFLFSRLTIIWADAGYTGKLIAWVSLVYNWTLDIIKKSADRSFEVLPRRWVVERTFGWFVRYRRPSKDYETLTVTSETVIYITMTHIMVKRLAILQRR